MGLIAEQSFKRLTVDKHNNVVAVLRPSELRRANLLNSLFLRSCKTPQFKQIKNGFGTNQQAVGFSESLAIPDWLTRPSGNTNNF